MGGGDILALVVGVLIALAIAIGYIWTLLKMRAQCRDMSRRVRISNAAPFRYRMQQYIRAEERENRRRQVDRRLRQVAQMASEDRARPRARLRDNQGARPVAPPAQQQQVEQPTSTTTTITVTPPAPDPPPPSYHPAPRSERSSSPPPQYTIEDEEADTLAHAMREPRTSLEALLPVHLRARTYMSLLAADVEDPYLLPPPYGYRAEGFGPPPAYDCFEHGGNRRASGNEQGQGSMAAGSILGTMVGWVARWAVRSRDARQGEAVLGGAGGGAARDGEGVTSPGWRETAAAATGGSGSWPSDP